MCGFFNMIGLDIWNIPNGTKFPNIPGIFAKWVTTHYAFFLAPYSEFSPDIFVEF